jgi:hypothetical protein
MDSRDNHLLNWPAKRLVPPTAAGLVKRAAAV